MNTSHLDEEGRSIAEKTFERLEQSRDLIFLLVAV